MSGGPGFYIDADDQRQKARLAEQRLLEHSATRQPRRASRYAEDDDEQSSLPPVFRREGQYANGRDTSVERRASRFRDGLPPPPPPVPVDEVPRLLPPPPPPLLDAYGNPVQPSLYPQQVQSFQEDGPQREYRRTAAGIVPVYNGQAAPAQLVYPEQPLYSASIPVGPGPLSESQKKRLRRKKNRDAKRTPSPAPFPLERDRDISPRLPATATTLPPPPLELTLPPSPTYPEITQTACDVECIVRMPNGSAHRLRCPLTPFPHPNQPHMVQLQSADPSVQAQVFIGFWMPGD